MTDPVNHSRRDVLRGGGAICGVLAAGGCVTFGSPGPPSVDAKFRLTSNDLRDGLREFLVDPLDVRANYSYDYPEPYKRSKITQLVEAGTVSTRGWELTWRSPWGPSGRDYPQCFRRDGTYYRIRVEEVEDDIPRERWVFLLDWTVDDPDADADVRTRPVETLSESDRTLLDATLENVPAQGRRPEDPVDFGIEFHDGLDPEESALAPDPPFDYLEARDETFGARTKRVQLRRKEQTFSAEAIAESEAEYDEYARSEFPDTVFDDVDLSSGARDVLDTATHPGGKAYEEEPPLSGDLEEVLEHLGIAEHLRPHSEYEERAVFNDALAEYENQWYHLDLEIYP